MLLKGGVVMPYVIDLFAGAGGLSLGASRAGFHVVSAVEIDKHAISSHEENFPNTRHIQKDILQLSGEELLRLSGVTANQVSGIIGGPPCQGFSSIGHGNVNDVRNTLFVKFFELVEEIHPAFFVAENVPGIMNGKYDEIRQTALAHVADYTVLPPVCINASEYGAATSRTRFFFIGYLNDGRINPITVTDIEHMKIPPAQRTTVRKALEGLPANVEYTPDCTGIIALHPDYCRVNAPHIQSDFFYQRMTGMRPAWIGNINYVNQYENFHLVNGFLPTNHSEAVKERYSKLQYGKQDRVSKSTRLNPDSFCPTLRAGTGPDKGSFQAVRPIHFDYARVITPREAARLQGFPDWYKLPNTIWHSFRQIGNSVSPIAAEQVLRAIFRNLPDDN